MSKIKVIIKNDGETVIKVEGHAGSGCKALTKELEKALGDVVEDKNTPEYYQQQQNIGNKQSLGMS